MDNRKAALRGLDLRGKTGLEIGPLNRPLVARSESRVFYADHCSTEALRAKYAINPEIPVDDIVSVDFDLSTGTLPELVAPLGPLDYVVASHVAEHVPDLIGWLKAIETVLRPGGVLALVLPDKRFTLDLHRRETAAYELEEAHAEARTRPDLRTVLDHILNIVTADVAALWRDPDAGRDAPRLMPIGVVAGAIEQWQAGAYLDAHCWVFTPWSCLSVLGAAIDRHGIGLRLKWARTTPYHQLEFYLQFEKCEPSAARTDWAAASRRLRRQAALLQASGVERFLLGHRRRMAWFKHRVRRAARGLTGSTPSTK
jgi:SAM-dependent methyltransferase